MKLHLPHFKTEQISLALTATRAIRTNGLRIYFSSKFSPLPYATEQMSCAAAQSADIALFMFTYVVQPRLSQYRLGNVAVFATGILGPKLLRVLLGIDHVDRLKNLLDPQYAKEHEVRCTRIARVAGIITLLAVVALSFKGAMTSAATFITIAACAELSARLQPPRVHQRCMDALLALDMVLPVALDYKNQLMNWFYQLGFHPLESEPYWL